jgi:hypothetical protein
MFPRIIFLLLLLSVSFVIASCKKKGKKNSEACNGNTRREVKIMTDASATAVDTTAIFTTIENLGELEVPDVNDETKRQEMEKKTYTVKCVVDKLKKERDGDIHLRLKSGDSYLIAESANPDCDYAANSKYLDCFKKVRGFLKENEDLEGKEVYITGVAFVDIDHHYKRKQAKNNLELHPILSIHF